MTFLKETLNKLNPSSKIIESTFGKINTKEILNTGMFDFEKAEQNAGWIEELNKEEHIPESEEYGISSFVYRTKKPFDPIRFWKFLQQGFPTSVIKARDYFGYH